MLQIPLMVVGDVMFQPLYRRMRINGKEIRLTERESDLLKELVLREGTTATRETLCKAMYRETGFWPASVHHVDFHIFRLRNKLKGSHVHIRAVRKRGFMLEVDKAKTAP